MIYLTRKEHFSSSHILNNPELDEKSNKILFGKCNNSHGHNYYLEVTLCGEIDRVSGYIVDLKILKKIISEEIIDKVDHFCLNDVNMFKNIIPTAENIAQTFWKILNDNIKFPNAKLYSIKLYETDKNFVEIRND
jgi:6-pyruvoyltetrahydropterin/6-carboxytetrahydropterin synthase